MKEVIEELERRREELGSATEVYRAAAAERLALLTS